LEVAKSKEKVKWHSSLKNSLIEFLLAGNSLRFKMLDGDCTCLAQMISILSFQTVVCK